MLSRLAGLFVHCLHGDDNQAASLEKTLFHRTANKVKLGTDLKIFVAESRCHIGADKMQCVPFWQQMNLFK